MKLSHKQDLYLKIDPISYLLASSEPWVRYNTLIHLLDRKPDNINVTQSKRDLESDQKIIKLILECQQWPGTPLIRHNDAKHIIHKIALLADFGLKTENPSIKNIVKAVLSNQSIEGAFLSNIKITKAFGGDDEPQLSWILCDAPILLYSLLSFGLQDNEQVKQSVNHLISLVKENGWRCVGAVPKFRGPGRKSDHCPYANLIALKALSLVPQYKNSKTYQTGIEAQLAHWENRNERKIYMFGIGSTFKKLKYPNIWYDILHVTDVLSRFSYARKDERFLEMLSIINSKQQKDSSFIPESIWRAYKDWSFGQKKHSSPWLTYRIALINKRLKDN